MKYRVYVERKEDQDTIAMIFVRNGYTVRRGREKQGNRYLTFIEYWRGTDGD